MTLVKEINNTSTLYTRLKKHIALEKAFKSSNGKTSDLPQLPSSETLQAHQSYLNNFVLNKSIWKFNKLKQIWILQHLWYTYALDKQNFKYAIKYMKKMADKAKTETLIEAQLIVDKQEELKCSKRMLKRAKKVIKKLS